MPRRAKIFSCRYSGNAFSNVVQTMCVTGEAMANDLVMSCAGCRAILTVGPSIVRYCTKRPEKSGLFLLVLSKKIQFHGKLHLYAFGTFA
jgi:hypothetical protein